MAVNRDPGRFGSNWRRRRASRALAFVGSKHARVSARPKAYTLQLLSAINGLVLVVFISGSAAAHHKHVVQRTHVFIDPYASKLNKMWLF